MKYVGIDAHKSQWTICVLNENGKKLLMTKVCGTWKDLLEATSKIPGPLSICFEASCGAGFLHDQLKKIAAKVVVAHPGKLKLIYAAKRKNDELDAERLAKILLLDAVPEVHIPKIDVRSRRALIELRRKLMGKRTAVKNTIRALLRSIGKIAPDKLWSQAGLSWLRDESFEITGDAIRRDMYLEELMEAQIKVNTITKELNRIGKSNEQVQLLMTVPGVGIRTAEAFAAYVDKAKRFSNLKSIGSYFGLVPTQDQSCDMNHLGHITRQGPSVVRWLLTEAAWEGYRRSPRIRSFFMRVQRNNPKRNKIAVVATAHYLARIMLSMLKNGEAWRTEADVSSIPSQRIAG